MVANSVRRAGKKNLKQIFRKNSDGGGRRHIGNTEGHYFHYCSLSHTSIFLNILVCLLFNTIFTYYAAAGQPSITDVLVPVSKETASGNEISITPGDKSLLISFKGATLFSETPEKLKERVYPVQAYRIFRSLEPKGMFVMLQELPLNEKGIYKYLDRDLENGKRYYYRVRAVDEDGREKDVGGIVYGAPADNVPPPPPSGLRIEAGEDELRLEWEPYREGDFLCYRVYRSDTSWGEAEQVACIYDAAQSFYADRGLEKGRRYFYHVRTEDRSNNISNVSREVMGIPTDRTPPSAPGFLRATGGDGYITLSWRSIPGGIKLYRIYRSKGEPKSRKSMELIGNAGPTDRAFVTYKDTTVENNVRYFYQVSAVDENGNESVRSLEADAVAVDMTPPPPPPVVMAKASDRAVSLYWVAPTVQDRDFAGYKIYRSSEAFPKFVEVATLMKPKMAKDIPPEFMDELYGPPSSAGGAPVYGSSKKQREVYVWNDAGLYNNMTYSYVITSFDRKGNESPHSMPGMATPRDVDPPPAPEKLKVTGDVMKARLEWKPVKARDLGGYFIYRKSPGIKTDAAGKNTGMENRPVSRAAINAAEMINVSQGGPYAAEGTPSPDGTEEDYIRVGVVTDMSDKKKVSYIDYHAPAGMKSSWVVTAFDEAGNESISSEAVEATVLYPFRLSFSRAYIENIPYYFAYIYDPNTLKVAWTRSLNLEKWEPWKEIEPHLPLPPDYSEAGFMNFQRNMKGVMVFFLPANSRTLYFTNSPDLVSWGAWQALSTTVELPPVCSRRVHIDFEKIDDVIYGWSYDPLKKCAMFTYTTDLESWARWNFTGREITQAPIDIEETIYSLTGDRGGLYLFAVNPYDLSFLVSFNFDLKNFKNWYSFGKKLPRLKTVKNTGEKEE